MASENVNLKISYVVIYVHECMCTFKTYNGVTESENDVNSLLYRTGTITSIMFRIVSPISLLSVPEATC